MRKIIQSVRNNCLITIAILCAASGICFFLQKLASTDTHVPLIFVLAVLFISRYTQGYFYGIVASVLAVVGVNYAFTEPYFQFNFTITGYPLTFCAMLAVAVSVSALTTQIKQQEQMKLEIEKEKMRGNLLRAVSHDIRTPLTSIVGSASAVLENYEVLEDDKKIELMKDIKEEAQGLVRIVENLLSVTRINGDRTKITTNLELVEEIVGSAVQKFTKRFPDIEVKVHIPDEALLVPMDAILIEQVLVNLLENSVLHGKTTTTVEISVFKQTAEILFVIEDDGQGIREDILPVVFEGGLHENETEESDSYRNMGIGLSVCMSIVKAHEGNMQAENKAGGGARMLFSLPLGKDV
jgi:two-component system sensor histidine kinase KdpD